MSLHLASRPDTENQDPTRLGSQACWELPRADPGVAMRQRVLSLCIWATYHLIFPCKQGLGPSARGSWAQESILGPMGPGLGETYSHHSRQKLRALESDETVEPTLPS
jgi:hypothetical protein